MNQFQIGDFVVIRSNPEGGTYKILQFRKHPKINVLFALLEDSDQYHCQWFNIKSLVLESRFESQDTRINTSLLEIF